MNLNLIDLDNNLENTIKEAIYNLQVFHKNNIMLIIRDPGSFIYKNQVFEKFPK